MIYNLVIPQKLDKKFQRLEKKDKNQLALLNKKIRQILSNPYHFKPLRGDLKGARRVHIHSSFVLIYEIEEKTKTVRLLEYEHHDIIY